MSQLNYPEGGIYGPCSGNIGGGRHHISAAISDSFFDIPEDFGYRGFLQGLNGTLNGYLQEINSIDARLRQTDHAFQSLSNNLEDRARHLAVTPIKERERMIVEE